MEIEVDEINGHKRVWLKDIGEVVCTVAPALVRFNPDPIAPNSLIPCYFTKEQLARAIEVRSSVLELWKAAYKELYGVSRGS